MKLKPKQRKKLLAKALERSGVCRCMALRATLGDVKLEKGAIMSAECNACGRTLLANMKTSNSAVVRRFLRCTSTTDTYCEHVIYWETNGVRVPHNLNGKELEQSAKCHCGKPATVIKIDPTETISM